MRIPLKRALAVVGVIVVIVTAWALLRGKQPARPAAERPGPVPGVQRQEEAVESVKPLAREHAKPEEKAAPSHPSADKPTG